MKYFRRLIWYISSRLLIICCVLALMITAFYLSMNATNIYIVVKDGMAKRAQTVMMGADADLTRYFASAYLARDPLLINARNGQSEYQMYYTIKGFDHRVNLDWFWCWPWEDVATATVTERIPAIDGRLKTGLRETAEENGLSLTPKWQTTRYSVLLTRENSQWRIKNLSVLQVLPDE